MLLPGLDVRNADFKVGAWCRYLVIDDAEGIVDTTSLYIAVVGVAKGLSGGTAFWLELDNGPYGSPPNERDTARALLSDKIRFRTEGDSLYHYIERLYTRKGLGPVEEADPRNLERFALTPPTSDSNWIVETDQPVETPMGTITCERKTFSVKDSKEIPRGKIRILQKSSDLFDVWTSPEVSLFHLVRCVVQRERESKIVPEMAGIPDTGAKLSKTTSVLIEYGEGAKPLIALPNP